MKHFGDITKIHGWEVPIVDVVTGGSPCQDLSVAGKREGLAGERSGLFMEQIRIVKEMREYDTKTNGHLGIYVRPRYLVWENVTGAFSSNGGEDFRAVLEETARIAEEGVSIPGLEKGQKWSNAGAICGDGWSIAWRVHDAQYWGVPQRRKRVCVLADFNGHTAADILFECFRETDSDDTYEVIGNTGRQPRSEIYAFRESVSGNPSQSEREGKEVAGSVGEGSDSASYTLKIRGGVAFALRSRDYKNPQVISYRKTGHPQTSDGGQGWVETEVNDTLNTFDTGEVRTPTLILENHPHDSRVKIREDNVFQTLSSRMGTGGNNVPMVMNGEEKMIVRRLTPMECERLQAFPDNWTRIGDWTDSKGKVHKEADSPRYKALGNSIALPFWNELAGRIVAQLREDGVKNPTMASLFDGIGGFPLVFQRNGCKPIWASEIEEFPMAVTKMRFPEGE